jgi:hypothetical protein
VWDKQGQATRRGKHVIFTSAKNTDAADGKKAQHQNKKKSRNVYESYESNLYPSPLE